MIILITGASHTGKTLLSQKLLEKYKFPYLSIDHLKMGLIRSGHTTLTPMSEDEKLTEYLWPIVCEMIKTAIENNQNMIVEGCYIPLDCKKYFEEQYLKHIRFVCLVMSEKYIRENFEDIKKYENVIENRLCSELDLNEVLKDNLFYLNESKKHGVEPFIIDGEYKVDFDFKI